MTSRAAHAAGFGPAVRHTAPEVLVTAFLTAKTLQAVDLCADPSRIGRPLRAFHIEMPAHIGGRATLFWVFHVIRDYARTLAAGSVRPPITWPAITRPMWCCWNRES